jgi:TfoX/Sxy family transcriptional regulator of competence genes
MAFRNTYRSTVYLPASRTPEALFAQQWSVCAVPSRAAHAVCGVMSMYGEPGLTERRMFGGLAFLIHGNMAVSASSQGGLLLRVNPAEVDSLISEPHVRRFEMRGRTMAGLLRVAAEVVEDDDDLRGWVRHGVTYARSLPPK